VAGGDPGGGAEPAEAAHRVSRGLPGIITPAWFQAPSGLWLPAGLQGSRARIALDLGRDSSGQQIVAVLDRLPSSETQMFAFVDERAIGLPVSDLPTQINRLTRVSFESAAFYISGMSLAIDVAPYDRSGQESIANDVITDPEIAAGIIRALREGRGSVVFAPQHLSALARLAAKHADPYEPARLDVNELKALERALLGCSALAMSSSELLTGEHVEPFDAVAFLVQSGAYYVQEPLLEALQRANWLYEHLAASEEARRHPDWRDLNESAVAASGLDVRQQLAVGFAALATARVLDASGPGIGIGLLSKDWADDLAGRLGVPVDRVLDLISADQSWYRSEFEAIESQYSLSADVAAAGWITSPFESRPFARLRDGRLVLWSPRALISWLTEGFYYRQLKHASETDDHRGWSGFNGALVETYARQIVEEVLPASKPAGGGRALGPVTYKSPKGEIESPDIALDYGQDLVFIEVRSGKLRLDTRLTGDPRLVERDLKTLIVDKATQLSRRIDDFEGGRFGLERVHHEDVVRIWPVVVTGASFLIAEPVYDWLMDELGDNLKQPRVQALTVLDITDFEQFCGLIEAGHAAPDLLTRKTQGYLRLNWRRMVNDDPYLPSDARAEGSINRMNQAFARLIEDFGWDPAALDEREL